MQVISIYTKSKDYDVMFALADSLETAERLVEKFFIQPENGVYDWVTVCEDNTVYFLRFEAGKASLDRHAALMEIHFTLTDVVTMEDL